MPLTTIQGTSLTLNPKTTAQLRALIDHVVASDGVFCDLNHIDISGVDDFTELFYRSPFMGDISGWNVSHVRCMRGMFEQSKFTTQFQPLGLSRWDVSGVTDMSRMFNRSAFDGDLSKWNVANVTTMEGTFWASKFNGDISTWNTENVRDMSHMFDTSCFRGDIARWNTAKVETMDNLFFRSPFEGDLSQWKFPALRSASNMFAYASFNGDIADWDVSQLQNMQGMFRYSVFKGDLSRWCVANATDLWDMFQGAAFVGNIQRWCWPLNAKVDNMFGPYIVASGLPPNLYHWHLAVVEEQPDALAPEHRTFLDKHLPMAMALAESPRAAARLLHTAWLRQIQQTQMHLPLPELALPL